MSAPARQATGAIAGTTSASPVWPTHVADDVGLLIVETETLQALTFSGAGGSGWTQIGTAQAGLGGSHGSTLYLYWKRAASGAEASPVITPAAGDHCFAQIVTFRGCVASGDPVDVTAGDATLAASTSVTIPGATTTGPDRLVVAVGSSGTDTTTPQFSAFANSSLSDFSQWFESRRSFADGGGWAVATGGFLGTGTYGATTATLASSAGQGRISFALIPLVVASLLIGATAGDE